MGLFKKMTKKGMDIYGKGQRMHREFERQHSILKAKELQRLRGERIRIEGKARLVDLKRMEQKRIMIARSKLIKVVKDPKKEVHRLSL